MKAGSTVACDAQSKEMLDLSNQVKFFKIRGQKRIVCNGDACAYLRIGARLPLKAHLCIWLVLNIVRLWLLSSFREECLIYWSHIYVNESWGSEDLP